MGIENNTTNKDSSTYYRLLLVRAKRMDANPEYDYFIVTNKGCIYNHKKLVQFLFNKRNPIYEKFEIIVDADYMKVYDQTYTLFIDTSNIPLINGKIDNIDSYLFDNFIIKFKPELQAFSFTYFARIFLYKGRDKFIKKEIVSGSLPELLDYFEMIEEIEMDANYDGDGNNSLPRPCFMKKKI